MRNIFEFDISSTGRSGPTTQIVREKDHFINFGLFDKNPENMSRILILKKQSTSLYISNGNVYCGTVHWNITLV